MEGLVVWAHSYCRSTLAFYRGLGRSWQVPLKIFIYEKMATYRKKTGFSDNEFADLDISYVNNIDEMSNILIKYKSWNHLFGAYQNNDVYRILMSQCHIHGIRYAICSESPCNMTPYPKRILKCLYLNLFLRYKVNKQIRYSDYIINYSGNDDKYLKRIGWSENKIIACGYYSPPIINSECVKRGVDNWSNFNILLSGLHQWHRSPMTLLKALHELDKKGIKYVCNITQEGHLFSKMKQYVHENNMHNVHLLGFVPLNKLIELYQTCSVYIGAGANEPWGMRLNDALQCGAPLVVCKGMGGNKLVNDYECGYVFERYDYKELSKIIEGLINDKEDYLRISNNAFEAAKMIEPNVASEKIAKYISSNYDGWS